VSPAAPALLRDKNPFVFFFFITSMSRILLILIFVVSVSGSGTPCQNSENTFGKLSLCNPTCTSLLEPYCVASLHQIGYSFCSSTYIEEPMGFYPSICNCPPNQTTDDYSPGSTSFGNCNDIPFIGQPCQHYQDCSITAGQDDRGWVGVCIQGVCAACDPSYYNDTVLDQS
jgi:hypothetical protein